MVGMCVEDDIERFGWTSADAKRKVWRLWDGEVVGQIEEME